MPSLWDRFSDLVFKALPRLLRPRLGARQALASFVQQGSLTGSWMTSWTESRYELVRHFKTWVYVAVDKVATGVAMNAPNVSHLRDHRRPKGDRSKWLSSNWVAQKALTPLMSHEQIEPVDPDHPLLRLLQDPNEPDTSYDFFYELQMYLELTGNAYVWCPPVGPFRRPGAMWVLPSHWVYAHAARDGSVDAYELRPVEGNYLRVAVPAEDVIHLKKKSPVSKVDGYSPLAAGGQWVDTQESIDRTRWYSFKNGIFPGVSIEFDAGVKLPDDRELDRIEARVMARYGGEHNSNKPMFVPPGAKLRPLTISPRELNYGESADQMRDNVLALFGVPATIAQVNSGMTYGSVRAAQSAFYALSLNPRLRYLGQQLTEKLAWRFDRGLKVWWEDKTPQDPEILEKQIATDHMVGATNANEVRALRGREPFPEWWANEPMVPLNTMPISIAIKRLESGAEPAGSQGKNSATQSSPDNTPNGKDDQDRPR